MSTASDQITEYLSIGGLFNPEMMNQLQHRAVRDTLIKARDDIQRLERENAALRADRDRLDFLGTLTGSGWAALHLDRKGLNDDWFLTRKQIDRRMATEPKT